jgi:citrate synthase
MERERMTAQEAAARLGVKRATLYAYVSRGLLESHTLDGKTSTFDPRQIERLQGRRRGARTSAVDTPVVSAITRIVGSTISYRGHAVDDLVHQRVPFEAVADLLWTGVLDPSPPAERWSPDHTSLVGLRVMQATFPRDSPILDRLRATTAWVSATDPLRGDLQHRSIVRAARPLLVSLVEALPRTGTAATADRALLADRLWPRLTDQRATVKWRHALNASLVLLADHDLAASTFAARVAASTRADVYSMVSAGLGPLGGALHGAASNALHEAFAMAAEIGAANAAAQLLQRSRDVGGFGHFLYPDGDPRTHTLLALVRDAAGDTRRAAGVDELIALLRDRLEQEPNIDCALAAMSHLTRMRDDAGEAIFAISRTAGWVAHGLAELDERPLRFRPVSRWVG